MCASQALLAKLHMQHSQQGQLEDVGVAVQSENARTFEDLKVALQMMGAELSRELAVRDEAAVELKRLIEYEEAARRESTEAVEAKAATSRQALEQAYLFMRPSPPSSPASKRFRQDTLFCVNRSILVCRLRCFALRSKRACEESTNFSCSIAILARKYRMLSVLFEVTSRSHVSPWMGKCARWRLILPSCLLVLRMN